MTSKLIALLLIDSDPAKAGEVRRVLARDQPDWRLSVAGSVAEAVPLLRSGVFDIILLRYRLADGDAFDLLADLSNKAVMLLVDEGQEGAAALGMRYGFGDYLVAGVDPVSGAHFLDKLAQRVQSVCGRYDAIRSMREDQQRFELAIDGYGLVPWDRNIVLGTFDGSERAAVMLGYTHVAAEWSVPRWRELTHPDDLARVQTASEAYLSGKTPFYECEYRLQHKDGHWVWVHSRARAVEWDATGRPVRLVGAFLDITSSRAAREASQRRNLLLQSISRAQASFIASSSNSSAFEGVLKDVLGVTSSEYGFVGEVLYDLEQQPFLRIHALTDISWDAASRQTYALSATTGIEFRNTRSLFGAALLTGKPVISSDPNHDPRSGGRPSGHSAMNSFLGVPIHNGGTMVAMLALANAPGGYTQMDVDFLEPLCQTIGQLMRARRTETERLEAIQALERTSEELAQKTKALETTLDSMDQGIATIDVNGSLGVYNQRWLQMLDLPAAFVAAHPTLPEIAAFQNERGDFGLELDLVDANARSYVAQRGTRLNAPDKYLRRTKDGRFIAVATRKVSNGSIVRTYADVTSEHKINLELQERLGFIEKITSRAPGVIVQFRVRPDGVQSFPYASAGFRDIFGVDPDKVIEDASCLAPLHHPDDLRSLMAATRESALNLTPWRYEYRLKFPDGTIKWLLCDAVPEREPDGSVLWCGFITDITARKSSEQQIEKLAFYDDLTGLANRRLLIERLQSAMRSSARRKLAGALLFIDLDNFKDLNDTQGHDVGDVLLEKVAQRLVSCVRGVDTVARLGGDEFVVLLADLAPTGDEAAAQAERVGRKILVTLNQPYEFAGIAHHSTPSIGVAMFHDTMQSVEELLKRADLAMYQAKAAGRNSLCFFEPAMQAVVTQRAELEVELRQGLLRNELMVYYQPVVDASGRMMGAEALARWQHPRRGVVSPGEFIPLAERTGLILPLGQWVLETVCRQLVRWSAAPASSALTIAVNVSARQFRHPDFVNQVKSLLQMTGANPNLLKLELTESMLLNDVQDVIDKMGEFKAMGLNFSLDDFGTGYSSLSYLKRLPFAQLKIDQSFVRDVLTDPNDAAIARTILTLARSLDLDVVAEGVETEAQRDFLMQNGCEAFQGYLFGRPVPAEDLKLV